MKSHAQLRARYILLAIAFSCLTFIITVWSVTLERVSHERSLALAHQTQVNIDIARLLSEQIGSSLVNIEQLLRIVSYLDLIGTPNKKIDSLLDDFGMRHKQLELAGVFDGHGKVFISDRTAKFCSGSALYTGAFKFHQTHAGKRLLIGNPVPDPLNKDGRLIPVSLRINSDNGTFGGIAFACLRQSYLSGPLDEKQLGAKADFFLIDKNGVVYAQGGIGKSAAHTELWTRSVLAAQAKSLNGNLTLQEKPGGGLELLSYQTLKKYPLILALATPQADALVQIRGRERIYYWVAALISLSFLAISVGLAAFFFWQRRVHQALNESQARYRAAFKSSPDAVNINRLSDGLYLEISDGFTRITGYAQDQVIGKTSSEINIWHNIVDRQGLLEALRRDGYCENLEAQFCLKNGRIIDGLMSASVITIKGEPCILSVTRDITERKLAETKIHRLSQLYSALSHCNQAIVSCTSEAELFDRVCQVVVQDGGMDMAWIGRVDDASRQVVPIAMFGEKKAFWQPEKILVSPDEPNGRGLVGTAIREDQPQWCQNFQYDSRTAPWHEAAAKSCIWSAGSLPLRKEGAVVGAFSIYSGKTDTFTAPVKELLIEMATDISHALNNFAREAERHEREQKLDNLSCAVEQSPGSIIITDLDGDIQYVNPIFEKITGYSSAEIIGRNRRAFQSGELPKKVYRELWATITSGKTWHGELLNRRKDGTLFWENTSIAPVFNRQGEKTGYVAAMEDITERKAAEQEIERLAYFDHLTNLPNRRLLMDRLKQSLAATGRHGRPGALLFIDLDDFKTLNDSLGHDFGDLLLQQVALRLTTCVREGDTVARFGGDEFIVMLEDLSSIANEAAAQAQTVSEKILAELRRPYVLTDHAYASTPSIGITLFSDQDGSVEDLLKRADVAMYQAKAAGRNTLSFYDPELQAALRERVAMEVELHRGIQEHQFLLYYQPQVDKEGRVTGAEVLVRWQHPVRGLVSPAEFIPLAEETGLILPLGRWVLETACRQLAVWSGQPATAKLSLAVNVSARQFHQNDYVEQVLSVLDSTGVDAGKLKLELTESVLLDDVGAVIGNMNNLRKRGVNFSLDDFGTGYSSLAYLKRLPLSQLKIDQSFVLDLLKDANDAAIACTIIALAKSLGLTVIAEGVETEAQRDFLSSNGCHAFQGYLYSRPLSIEAFEAFISKA